MAGIPHAKEIDPREWAERGYRERLFERLARVFVYWL
jgi:hypothetical protein